GERATEVASFVMHLGRVFYRLTDLVAQQNAIALPHAVDQFFYEAFGNMKFRRQRGIREIVPLRAQVRTQHFEDSSAPFALAFFTKPAKCALYHRRRPTRIENSFCRPGSTCFVG